MLNPELAGLPLAGAYEGALPDVQAFARIHAGRPTPAFVSNLSTQIELVGSGAQSVPVTINNHEGDNAWVCSPYTAYCAYAIEELERLAHPAITQPLSWLCRAAGANLRRAEIDRAVAINNWLLSTNLYPALDRATLRLWIAECLERWPAHSLWFRSLNDAWTSDWIAALVAEGFELIPSRQVYLYSDVAALPRSHADLKVDLKLLQRTVLRPCGPSGFGAADWPRIEALYAKLYLEKYSRLNPAYRASFMEAWHRAGLLRLMGFRDGEGVLQAIVGTFERDGVITAPIVGYDTALPKKLGLYRMLMAAVLKYAADSGQRVNLSAGAAEFKRGRGGVPAIEYSAVFSRHLPKRRQRAVERLRWLTTRIGVPLMKRFEL